MINLADYNDFYIFLVGLLIIGGLIYILFGRPTLQITLPKIPISVVFLIIIIGGFLLNQYLMWRIGSSGILGKLFSISINLTRK